MSAAPAYAAADVHHLQVAAQPQHIPKLLKGDWSENGIAHVGTGVWLLLEMTLDASVIPAQLKTSSIMSIWAS